MIDRSIRYQFAGAIVLIEVVMLSLLLWSTLDLLGKTYRNRLDDSARNIADQYAATAARYLFEADIPSLAEYTEQVSSHEELRYFKVHDRTGRLIYAYGELPADQAQGARGGAGVATDDTFEVSAPIALSGQSLGHAELGFSLELMQAALSKARTRGVAIAAGEVFLTVLAGLWIGGRLTRDLRSLADATEAYGAGKTGVSVEVASANEVGRTARAFNQMIADRRNADEALRRNEEKFRALVENSKDLIVVISREGLITYVSPSASQLLGLSPDAVLRKPVHALLGGDAGARLTDMFRRLRDRPDLTLRDEIVARREGAAEVVFEYIAQSYLDDPAVEGLVLNFWDVTERRRIEEQLRQSLKMEAIGNLTGGVAHDFNNLLAIVLGNIELLKDAGTEEERARYLEASIKAIDRGAELTRNMLSFARRAPLRPTVLDLNDLVRSTKNWSARALPENIQMETSLLAGLWKIEADPVSTENALLNLILNARDAMPAGGRLTLETSNLRVDEDYLAERRENLEPGRYVMLAVSDTGVGIAPDAMNRIFEPFFTTKPPGRGSGLGLSMIQGFMQQSRGTVRVYSEPGAGTTFKLYFRAVTDGAAASPGRRSSLQAISTGARLLVAEDEEGVREMLVRTLENAGYVVIAARTGDEAKELFETSGPINLLLTDIVMPGRLQGPMLVRELRAIDPLLPAIFMSGYADEAMVHGNGLRPEDIRLMKPASRAALIAAIEKALAAA